MFLSFFLEFIYFDCRCIFYKFDYSSLIVLDLKGKIFWGRRVRIVGYGEDNNSNYDNYMIY